MKTGRGECVLQSRNDDLEGIAQHHHKVGQRCFRFAGIGGLQTQRRFDATSHRSAIDKDGVGAVVSRQDVAQSVAMIPVECPHLRLLRSPARLSAGHSRMHDEWMQIYLAPQL
eukprot:scaffold39534_cov84-Phaeocystis_antarctica.AAC.1